MGVQAAIPSIAGGAALDRELRGGVERDRDPEAPRDVVRAAGGDQRELDACGGVRGRVERPVAPEEHDAPLSRGERVVELFEGRRQAGLDARSR